MNTEHHLNEVALKQLTWKPTVMRNVARVITEAAIKPPHEVWPDQVDLSTVGTSDRNCIGSAWRMLTKAGLLEPTAEFRRSESKDSRGRKIFKYRLVNHSKATTWLTRNQFVAPAQPDLFRNN